MAIKQRPAGKIVKLGGVGRVVRRARVNATEVPSPKQWWRIFK